MDSFSSNRNLVVSALTDLSRLCIHTITNKPWSLQQCLAEYQAAGIRGVTVWRDAFPRGDAREARRLLDDSGISVVSLCRGGFFPAPTEQERQRAIDDNRKIIEEAATVGAPLVVLVCGAHPAIPLEEARRQICDGIAAILPDAASANVKLAIEPLHPMYADSRSAINTLRQANDIVQTINHPYLGVTVDVYHLWWDTDLEQEIARARRWLFSYHVSDWRTPTRDLLNDRALMGTGCIPLRRIRNWVEQAGFQGFIEVEIFSNELWATDQREFLRSICTAYLDHC